MTSVCSSSSICGCWRTTCARQPISAAPVRSPPAWMMRARVCAASSPKRSRPSAAAIEARAQGEQLVNPVRAFACEDSDGFGVGQAVAGGEGVGGVLARAVAGAEGHRDAALRPGAGAVGERFLGDHDRRLSLGSQPPGRPEAGDARSDDHGASGHDAEYTAASPRYVLTRASSTSPATRNTMFGSHAASVGSISPPAPTAFMIWVTSRKMIVVPRLIAMPTAAPARGACTASGAPNSAMMRQVAGSASLSACSTISLLASLPDRLRRVDVAAELRVAHLVRAPSARPGGRPATGSAP